MSHRKSAAVAAAQSKASWDTVDVSRHHHDNDKDIVSTQNSSPTAGIFKQRKAIGRHTELRTNSGAPRRTKQDGANYDEKLATGKKSGKGPPSLLDRPRSSTGFEDYFDEVDIPAKLRSLKAKPSLQDLKRLTLWERDQNNLPISPRERRCFSSLEKKDLESKYSKSNLKTESAENRKRRTIKSNGTSKYQSSLKYNEDMYDEKDDNDSDMADKIKAFRALVSPGAKSRREGQTQRDISNEQLKKAKSFSSLVEDVGGYLKFSAQSAGTGGMRSSTPLNVEGENEDNFEYVNRNLEDLTLKPYLRSKSFVDLSSFRGREVNQLHVDQRNDVPSSFKGNNLQRFGTVRSEVGSASNQLFSTSEKHYSSEMSLSEKKALASSKENGIRSDTRSSGYNLDNDLTNGKPEEGAHFSSKRRVDSKRVIRRSPDRDRNNQGNRSSNRIAGEGFKPNYHPDLEKIDKEVLRYMVEAKERRQQRDQFTYSVQKRSQSPSSEEQNVVSATNTEWRPRSSLEVAAKPREYNVEPQDISTRPFSALETSNRLKLDLQAAVKNKSNVESITHDKEKNSDRGDSNRVPGKQASLRTHLNALGASLSSLSSRLTSGSESDLGSHNNDVRTDGAGDVMVSEKQRVKDASMAAGTGGAAEILSHDIATSTPRRQSGGGRVTSPFDVAHVRISIREDGLDLQTWASSSSLVSGSNAEPASMNSHGQRRISRSVSSAAVKADHSIVSDASSSEIGSLYGGRQTNVKVLLQDGSLTPRTESSLASTPRQRKDHNSSRHARGTEKNLDSNSSNTCQENKSKERAAKNATEHQKRDNDDTHSIGSRTSDSIGSENQTLDVSEGSEFSLEDTLVSDNVTQIHGDGNSSQRSPLTRSEPASNETKPNRPKVISRKTPLKALHPINTGQIDEKDADSEHARHNGKQRSSPDKKEKVILVKRPTDVREENIRPRISSLEDSSTVSRSSVEMLKANVRSLASSRSKSSLGLFSNTSASSSMLNSPLPSKANLKQLTDKVRPKTSLAISSSMIATNRKSSRTIKQKMSKPEADSTNPTRGVLLKQKVQKLHDDIAKRLKSRENSSYSINSSYDNLEADGTNHSKQRDRNDIDMESETSDSDLSDASTILRVYSPEGATITQSPRSPRPPARRRSPGIHSDISSPPLSPKQGFVTSTPVKIGSPALGKESIVEPDTETKRRLLRKVVRELSKGEAEKETDTAQRYRYGRFTPDTAMESHNRLAQRNRLLRAKSRETESLSEDDDDDDDKDFPKDGRRDLGLRRSESVGSLLRSNENSNNDFMNKILGKIGRASGDQRQNVFKRDGPSGLSAVPAMAFTDNNNRLSGRQSPADLLLDHLDNPQMVKLLQRLYKADPDARKILMVKFQYFKAWVCHTRDVREKRIKKEALTSKSESHLRYRLLCLHFVTWWQRAMHCAHVRRADALLRRHTLAKGLKALSWSLSQSRHTAARIEANVRTSAIRRAFGKWKTGAVKHRLQRKQAAFARWNQFVTETKKIRHMRHLMEFNLQQEVIRCWHKRYRKRTKLNMAFLFFRQSLCQKAVSQWKLYVTQCKLAQEKLTSAVVKHQKTLLNNAFYCMLVSFKKVKKAKAHFRAYKLSETLWAWREAAQVCHTERLRDMAASTEHWRSSKLRQGFSQWREALQVRRLHRLSEANLYRSAFTLWYVAWQRNIERREAIEVTLTQNKLRGALLTWRQNVVRLRARHKKAVIILEHCHLKQTFKCWRMYTAWKGILKKKVLIHSIEKSRYLLLATFAVWKDEFSYRMEQERAKQLWSAECARKCAAHWRGTCHKRNLYRLHQDVLRPLQENRMLRAMFTYWITSLERRHLELERADEMRERLQKSRLGACFALWQRETSKALLLKPLQQRREKKRMTDCLYAWRGYVARKSQSRANYDLFKRKVMKFTFETWRRQHLASQISKQRASLTSQGLLLCFLEAWRFLIDRKRKSREFRKCKLVRSMFLSWRGRASFEMDRRARLEEEEASNQSLLKHCFYVWRENSIAQSEAKERSIEILLKRRCERKLCTAFLDWRRHLHSTLVSRAYQKSLGDRLLATLLCEWREVTSNITHNAVRAFSERIGLRDHVTEVSSAESGIGFSEDQDFEEAMNRSVASLNSSFSFGSSVRRLYGETTSSFDTDTDRMVLLSGGLQASVNDHQVKCQKLKEMATLAILRLKNWPACLAFDQWREFTERERQLKKSGAELRARVATLEQMFVFRVWRENYRGASIARKHRTHHLMQAAFEDLRAYKNHRKFVKSLNLVSQAHCMLVAGRKYFSPWLTKAQEQRKQKQILHLWSSRTEQEMRLLPLETQLTNQITRRSIHVCFSIWLVRYKAVTSLKAVVRRSLLSWVFTSWRNWAEMKHDLVTRSKTFRDRRTTKLVFARWCDRLIQAREVERRHQEAWKSYLLLILQQWRRWSAASTQLALIRQEVNLGVSRRHLAASFSRWRSMAVKVRSAQSNMSQRLVHSVFAAWRAETVRRKEETSLVLQCQVRSYTLLVERLFRQWSAAYRWRQQERQERQLQAEGLARTYAQHWRHRAQTSRGLWLKQQLDTRKMVAAFTIWTSRLDKVHDLYSLLETSQRRRETVLMSRSLQTWRLQLSSARAVRLRQGRLLVTVLAEWRVFTKESKDRRIRDMALKKALQERSLHVYFSYWVTMARTSQSIQQSVEKRILFRFLRGWRDQSRNQKQLRNLYSHFRYRVETRMLQGAFQTLRWRADYCAGLQDTMQEVIRDKERATLKAVITVWRDRLDNILAHRFYVHLLMVRSARKWQRFVARNKLRRQTDAQNLARAVRHHGLTLCRKIFQALKTEVTVSMLAHKHRVRLCYKYARMWKTKVDLVVTARAVERETAIRKVWKHWRISFNKKCAAHKVASEEKNYVLNLIFTQWRKTYSKRSLLSITDASASYGGPYLKPVNYLATSSSQPSSSLSAPTTAPSLLPLSPTMLQKRPSLSPPSPPPMSAANTSFGFRGGAVAGRRKQN